MGNGMRQWSEPSEKIMPVKEKQCDILTSRDAIKKNKNEGFELSEKNNTFINNKTKKLSSIFDMQSTEKSKRDKIVEEEWKNISNMASSFSNSDHYFETFNLNESFSSLPAFVSKIPIKKENKGRTK